MAEQTQTEDCSPQGKGAARPHRAGNRAGEGREKEEGKGIEAEEEGKEIEVGEKGKERALGKDRAAEGLGATEKERIEAELEETEQAARAGEEDLQE